MILVALIFLDSLIYIIQLIMKYIKLVLFKKDMMEESINKIVMAQLLKMQLKILNLMKFAA